jgi:hypothetical protein
MLLSVVCSNPGHPFSSGVTLAKLAAVTMDEQGNETFDTSGALDRLRKVRLFVKIVYETSIEGQHVLVNQTETCQYCFLIR